MTSVYVAYTGGTIGMKQTAQGFAPVPGYLENALKVQPEFQDKSLPEIHLHEYSELIDSSNITPEHWNIIAEDISNNYERYDGFVILHGTDTMAYSASALSFMLENLSKPVIFTGSQIPFSQLRSDARDNFIGAVQLAASSKIPEVCLYFHNTLYRGNCCSKTDSSGFSAYQSPNYPALASVGIDIKINKALTLTKPENPLHIHRMGSVDIGTLHMFPGVSPQVLENYLRQPVKGLVLMTYGAGNIPSNNKALVAKIKDACDRGIVIVNCSQCLKGSVDMSAYETGSILERIGVVNGADMQLETCITKLSWLLSIHEDPELVRSLMSQNLRGELRGASNSTMKTSRLPMGY
ncbi:MAG: L-asparaginase 1 [Gammaproteobacteria bacterium]|nr:MAG: L-asparaginase 1 [Gammaproteobacteria bacterium]